MYELSNFGKTYNKNIPKLSNPLISSQACGAGYILPFK